MNPYEQPIAPRPARRTVRIKLPPSRIRKWIRRGFLSWAVVSTCWLANSFRTRGVDENTLQSSPAITVLDHDGTLEFMPVSADRKSALIFICGSGVSASAYAPLLRPIAEAGYAVFVVKLPYRFAPFESHKITAMERARGVKAAHAEFSNWVVSGHSLGGALACRVTLTDPTTISALVLVGTTHPKQDDLSFFQGPVTKVYGSNDGVAPVGRILANRGLLPEQTKWVEIKGGNHSQFGHYGHQILDGTATITREALQQITRAEILAALSEVEH